MCIKRRILTEYVTLDIETTGFNFKKHKIIEIAVCKVKYGNIVDERTFFVNPKEPIHQAITEITGIRNNELEKAETIDKVIPRLLDFIGQLPIVLHHSYFVMGFLKQNFTNLNISLDNQIIDTLPLCKKKLPNLKDYTIKTISKFLEDDNVEIDSLIDYARWTFRVFEMVR